MQNKSQCPQQWIQRKPFCRVVITLDDHYHCLSRRYRCKVCEEKAKAIVANYSNLAENHNLRANFKAPESQYSFMAWNKRVLPLYANGLGDEFPAFLTWRAGVDKLLLDLMRPLYDKGLRPEALSDTLLELHSKRYHQEYRKRELKIVKMSTLSGKKGVLFSDFTDKRRYNGRCPTGQYLQMVYKTYHSAIKDFLDREVKKRGATRIHIDASYKEAKHLCQYHGENLFKGLITATNEFGEIRLQFHVVTDDHEQFLPAFSAFFKTIQEYGQPEVKLLSTDNVAGDRNFYLEILPSLRRSQTRVDALAATAETEDENENRLPNCVYDKDNVTTLGGQDIVTAIHDLNNDLNSRPTGKHVIGLDAEWNVEMGAHGFPKSVGRVALLILVYQDKDLKAMKALLLRVHNMPNFQIHFFPF